MMINFIAELYNQMNETLQKNQDKETNLIRQTERACGIVEDALRKLKEFILSYHFRDRKEEISFFKKEKPLFLKEYIYYTELFYIESGRPVGSKDAQQAYLTLSLERIQVFFYRNSYFYTYYRAGQTYLDHLYFVRKAEKIPLLPAYSIDMDPRFSTTYSYKISKLQAFEELKDYLQVATRRLNNPLYSTGNKLHRKRWHGTKTELIELGYALQSRGVFGSANVKQVIHYLEDCFDIRVGNFYRVFQGQRIRKKSRTLFLDSLKENLIRRMDDNDLNPKGF